MSPARQRRRPQRRAPTPGPKMAATGDGARKGSASRGLHGELACWASVVQICVMQRPVRWVRGARSAPVAACCALALTVASVIGGAPHRASADDAPPDSVVAAAPPAASAAPAPVVAEPRYPFLDDEDATASVSIGDTSHGRLANGKQLVESAAIGILPRQKARDPAYGTSEMIALLEHAATALHDETGTRLWIGDISRRGGGDIAWSISHNSGRDADVALAYIGPDGAPADPPDLVRVDAKGDSADKALRFDAARTWTIVRAILEFKGADVQFLFLAAPLKRRLLEYAAAHRAPADVGARAREVIMQPGAAHDDHLHVRIHCGVRDVGGGSRVESGVQRAWANDGRAVRAGCVNAAVAQLAATEAGSRRAAIERLALLDADAHAADIAPRLDDAAAEGKAPPPPPRSASSARRAASPTSPSLFREQDVDAADRDDRRARTARWRGRRARDRGDPRRRSADLRIARADDTEGDEAVESEVDVLFSPAPTRPALARRRADRGARGQRAVAAPRFTCSGGVRRRLEPVPALIAVEASRARSRSSAATWSTRSRGLVNRRFGDRWSALDQLDDERRAAADRVVRGMGEDARQGAAREPSGSRRASSPTTSTRRCLDAAHAWDLVRGQPRRDHLAYNAHRALERMTGRRAPWLAWDDPSACDDWVGYLNAHRAALQVPALPKRAPPICPRAARD